MSSFDSSGISELKWSDGQTNLILKKERGAGSRAGRAGLRG